MSDASSPSTVDVPPLLLTEEGGVRVITLNRPAEMNAANGPLHEALGSVWSTVAADAAARKKIEMLAMAAVIKAEEAKGHRVVDAERERGGLSVGPPLVVQQGDAGCGLKRDRTNDQDRFSKCRGNDMIGRPVDDRATAELGEQLVGSALVALATAGGEEDGGGRHGVILPAPDG